MRYEMDISGFEAPRPPELTPWDGQRTFSIPRLASYSLGAHERERCLAAGEAYQRKLYSGASLRGQHIEWCARALDIKEIRYPVLGDFYTVPGLEGEWRIRLMSIAAKADLTMTTHRGKGRHFDEKEFYDELDRRAGTIILDIASMRGSDLRTHVFKITSKLIKTLYEKGDLHNGLLSRNRFDKLRGPYPESTEHLVDHSYRSTTRE